MALFEQKWYGPPGVCGRCGCWWCDEPVAVSLNSGGYGGCCAAIDGTYAVANDPLDITTCTRTHSVSGPTYKITYAFAASGGLPPPPDYFYDITTTIASGTDTTWNTYFSMCTLNEGTVVAPSGGGYTNVDYSDFVALAGLTVVVSINNSGAGAVFGIGGKPKVTVTVKQVYLVNTANTGYRGGSGFLAYTIEITDIYQRELDSCKELLTNLAVPHFSRVVTNINDPASARRNVDATGFDWGWGYWGAVANLSAPLPYRFSYCPPLSVYLVF